MNYRNYSNGSNFFWLGLILFIAFGGIRVLFAILSVLLALAVSFFPFIIMAFIGFRLLRRTSFNNRMHRHVAYNNVDHSRFVELLVHILIAAVKADGKVDDNELRVIRDFFRSNLQYAQVDMEWVDDLMTHALDQAYPLDELCDEFRRRFDRGAALILLQLTYRVMLSDRHFDQAERGFIAQLVQNLHIPEHEHSKVKALFDLDASHDHHHEILGVSEGASKDDIKKAYRKACKEYHPDKVHHLGEEFRKVAEEKIKKINEAYDVLMKAAA